MLLSLFILSILTIKYQVGPIIFDSKKIFSNNKVYILKNNNKCVELKGKKVQLTQCDCNNKSQKLTISNLKVPSPKLFATSLFNNFLFNKLGKGMIPGQSDSPGKVDSEINLENKGLGIKTNSKQSMVNDNPNPKLSIPGMGGSGENTNTINITFQKSKLNNLINKN